MAVPEPAVHEDRHAIARERNVGLAGKVSHVASVTDEASFPERVTQGQFGFRVAATDGRHVARARRRRWVCDTGGQSRRLTRGSREGVLGGGLLKLGKDGLAKRPSELYRHSVAKNSVAVHERVGEEVPIRKRLDASAFSDS